MVEQELEFLNKIRMPADFEHKSTNFTFTPLSWYVQKPDETDLLYKMVGIVNQCVVSALHELEKL